MTIPVNGAWAAVKALITQTLPAIEVFDTTYSVRSNRGDARGFPKVEAGIRSWRQYTPAAGAIADGPVDAVMLDEEATITAQLVDDVAGVTSPPLAPGVWHSMQATHVTATSASSNTVWLGFLRRHGT